MNRKIVIKVAGPAGAGKTTVSLLIEEALRNYDIPVALMDEDGEEYLRQHQSKNRQADRINALKKGGLSVTIIQTMTSHN